MLAKPVSARVAADMASTSSSMCARRASKSWAPAALMPSQASRQLASRLVALDEGVGRVVVDRLEVLRLDHELRDALVEVEHGGDVAHHVLDELGIVVGALGDVLLVRALEQAVELARGLLLHQVDELLVPDEFAGGRRTPLV